MRPGANRLFHWCPQRSAITLVYLFTIRPFSDGVSSCLRRVPRGWLGTAQSIAVASEDSLGAGLRAGLPIGLPMVLIGISFGVTARSYGWGVVAPIVMSLLVFGGAGQIATLGVLGAGGSVPAAVLAGGLVNLRFLIAGLAIGTGLHGGVLRRSLLSQSIVDASVVLARTNAGYGGRRLVGSTVPQWLGWQVGTVVGVFLAGVLANPDRYGIDALFPAFFFVLLLREVRGRALLEVAVGAAVLAGALIPVAPAGVPVVFACAAIMLAGFRQ